MFSIMSNYGLSFAIPFPTLPHYLSIMSSRRLFFVFPGSQGALSCFVSADSRTIHTARRPIIHTYFCITIFHLANDSPLSDDVSTPFFLGFFRFCSRSKKPDYRPRGGEKKTRKMTMRRGRSEIMRWAFVKKVFLICHIKIHHRYLPG